MNAIYQLKPIGVIHSCFGEKFGIPRQPGLVPDARATLELMPPYDSEEAVRGLDSFSHVWIVFLFHATVRERWKATVRPPRLGGNERLGVFATRSNFRPNPIGLSVVKLEQVRMAGGGAKLELSGGDFLDGTPVLDIKPYLSYADAIDGAVSGFAAVGPEPIQRVDFTPQAAAACERFAGAGRPGLRRLIEQMLGFSVQPAYISGGTDRIFGTKVYGLELRWQQDEERVLVIELGED
jgi:tRNA (adenine37-N6)-methyltransferase